MTYTWPNLWAINTIKNKIEMELNLNKHFQIELKKVMIRNKLLKK